MWIDAINPDEFLRVTRNALEAADADALASRVSNRWNPTQLCQMLHDGNVDARRVACVTLGLVGGRRQIKALVAALRDADRQVTQAAEHALWHIWCRGGNVKAQRLFKQGMTSLTQDRPAEALGWFEQAHGADATYAEACHQAAIACQILEWWGRGIEAGRMAVECMPEHFGAWTTLGHCYAHLDKFDRAAECYREAVAIHPHLDPILQALRRLEG